MRFFVPLGHGQKTGWFYDQAANRSALLKYVRGARVLDVFSYLGAWGLAAARAGASEVLCVDSSAPALELLQRSAAANGLDNVRTERADAFDALAALRAAGEKFDVVIIDPPAFIKRRKDAPKGQAAYRKLNQLAMQVLARDGFLVSCSCSHHLAQDDLIVAIQQAARHVDRFAQVVEVGGHAPDHPAASGDPRDALPQVAVLPGRAGLTAAQVNYSDPCSSFRTPIPSPSRSGRCTCTGTASCTWSASSSAWWLARRRAAAPQSTWTPADVDDFIFFCAVGVILGGRLGWMLFYGTERILTETR